MVDVDTNLAEVNFSPPDEATEIIQNVKTILSTLKGTVPMDREFGISGEIIDLPISAAQAQMTAEIVDAVNKYEPRAQVVSVNYEDTETDGNVVAKVRLKINGT